VGAQLVEALRYKLESLGFHPQPHYGTGIDSASNGNEYQEYFLVGKGGRCVGLTLPPSRADCIEIWEPQPPGKFRACPGQYRDCFTLLLLLPLPLPLPIL